jgi:SAM-dependent methyltransferase
VVKDWFEPSQFITFEHAMEQQKEWFKEWFNSPYYHILYGDRDQQEAEFFLRNLVQQFSPAPQATFLDLACGAGRHSIFLNNLGFQVTGIDLSKHSISIAKQYENPSLHFEVGDLRTFHLPTTFDFVLNLFTSFGYFDCMDTNKEVLHQVKQSLKPNGVFIIDFMNADKILENLIPFELKERQGIVFEISKTIENGIIIKDISFTDQGKSFHYQEKVQALTLNDFNNLLSQCGFQLLSTFGNYALESYDRQESDRLILVSQLNHA